MNNVQSGILLEIPALARYLVFNLKPGVNASASLAQLNELYSGDSTVIGLGQPFLQNLNKTVTGMRDFTARSGPGFAVPSTPAALWVWLRGEDRGELLHQTRAVEHQLSEYFVLDQVIDAFQYRDSRDLTGYEDGTENPEGNEAIDAAIVQGQQAGMDGSSFVAVQQWVHNLDHFQSMPQQQQDHTIGRQISDNEEIDDAPESAHVKRTAQEDFEPEAFVLRRSMPWAEKQNSGLQFVAFGHSFDAFEALLNRMVGAEDGIVDALFSFTHPLTGYYFWCPPVKDNQLDLSLLG
jgi:putative iron-dependent peroxidase